MTTPARGSIRAVTTIPLAATAMTTKRAPKPPGRVNAGDDRQHGGRDREGHDVAKGKDTAAPLAVGDPADEDVVDGDLSEYDEHERDGDDQGTHAGELIHER